MGIYIKTHIVRHGETLENIVSEYGISDVELLRYFHNRNASKNSNHLEQNVHEGQEIFIPSKLDIEKILSERKALIIERDNAVKNSLLLPDRYAIKQNYKVKIIYSSSGNSGLLEFNTQVKYVGLTEEKFPVIQYKKENFLINEVSESKLYDLAVTGTKFLYPLEFSIHLKNVRPYKITNLKEIQSRWNATKESLQKNYNDPYSLKYIKTMDEAMRDGFSKYFMSDLFIQFLLAPYAEFNEGQSSSEKYFHAYRMAYQEIMDIEILDENIQVNQNAYCIDSRTAQQILAKWNPQEKVPVTENELVQSDISGIYQLNKKNKILQNANIKMSTWFYDEEEVIEIKIDVMP